MRGAKTKGSSLDKVKQTLLERKKRLEEELSSLYAEKDSDDQGQDAGDQAFSAALETLKNSLQSNELEEYKMVVKALKMIDSGAYGICSDCQKQISEKRLQSYPNAARCLSCQEILEDSINKGMI